MRELFTIGDVSRICNIAASTLRYYDKIGLIKPDSVNSTSDYRYYSYTSIARIKIIQDLRHLNFSIPEITKIIKDNHIETIMASVSSKKKEILNEIKILQNIYDSLDLRLENIKSQYSIISMFNDFGYSIEVKHLPVRYLFSIRLQKQNFDLNDYTLNFVELATNSPYAEGSPLNLMLIHHHIDFNSTLEMLYQPNASKDVEFAFPIHESNHAIATTILPEGNYLTLITKGMAGKEKFESLYKSIQEWLNKNNYIVSGPFIDVIISDISFLQHNYVVDQIVSEIQILIQPKL